MGTGGIPACLGWCMIEIKQVMHSNMEETVVYMSETQNIAIKASLVSMDDILVLSIRMLNMTLS